MLSVTVALSEIQDMMDQHWKLINQIRVDCHRNLSVVSAPLLVGGSIRRPASLNDR